MANIMSRQQWRLQKERGFTEEQARVLAYKQQRNKGRLEGNTFKLNEFGQQISQLGPWERAILRRSQETGRPTYHYKIQNGRPVLKDAYKKRR